MARITRLSVIRSDRKREIAKGLRHDMFNSVRSACHELKDNLGGYALVTWSDKGETISHFKTFAGVAGRTVPRHVGDALQQHVASALVNQK